MKPTVLAFHGSGSNAMVHSVQLARLMRVAGSDFEFESLEGMSFLVLSETYFSKVFFSYTDHVS